jgi:hypothetical protein
MIKMAQRFAVALYGGMGTRDGELNLKFFPNTPKKFRGTALSHQVWQERHVYEYMTSVPNEFTHVPEFSV